MGWGDNQHGQCNPPSAPPGTSFVQLAAGGHPWMGGGFSLGRLSNGGVIGWGSNNVGALAVPTLPPGVTFVDVASSELVALGLRSDGQVSAWGSASLGGTNVPPLPPGVTYVEADAGLFSIARRSDGSVVAWGQNDVGQLDVPTLASGLSVAAITAGQKSGVLFYEGACPTPATYCTAKLNSLGCTPTVSFTGTPSASHATSFAIRATSVISNSIGILIYSKTGPAAVPFQGGLLCVGSPVIRSKGVASNGNPPPNDCSGKLELEFNDHIASGVDPALVAGQQVWSQFWYRDVNSPGGSGLSDALHFTICP